MKSLLKFFYRFHYIILFFVFEISALTMVVQYNDYHRSSFLNSSSSIAGGVYNTSHNISQYFGLRSENIALNKALANYRHTDQFFYKDNRVRLVDVYDSVFVQQYEMIPAEVINNSVNKQNNFLTINAGRRQGVTEEMAVVAGAGIVGIVKDVSDNYAAVISVLNHNLRVSAMVKRNGFYGSLIWDGLNYRQAKLIDLPNHITVLEGDTIITSGYSAMFPKGEMIGIVDEIIESRGGDFIEVTVNLAVDFRNCANVLVVKNLLKEEQLKLEIGVGND